MKNAYYKQSLALTFSLISLAVTASTTGQLTLTDSSGVVVPTYQNGESAYIQVADSDGNADPAVAETLTVKITSETEDTGTPFSATTPIAANSNVGDGTLTVLKTSYDTKNEDWSMLAVSANSFLVTGSVSGQQSQQYAITDGASEKHTYISDNNEVSFFIENGSIAFTVGDTFTFSTSAGTIVGETVTLTETDVDTGVFTNSITLNEAETPNEADGILDVQSGDLITVFYDDASGDWGDAEQARTTALYAATVIKGSTLLEDTIWTEENSPYLVTGDVTVSVNTTLTIMPGVKVLFLANSDDTMGGQAPYDSELIIQGSLNVAGTEAKGVILTSSNREPAIGDWGGIRVENSTASITYTTLEYSAYGVDLYNVQDGNVFTLSHSEVANNGLGIRANYSYNGIFTLTNNAIRENSGRAIDSDNSYAYWVLEGNTISDNGRQGDNALSFGYSHDISFIDNEISGNSGGVQISEVRDDLIFTGNTLSNNKDQYMMMSGGLNINTWSEDGEWVTDSIVIEDNIIDDNSYTGIQLHYSGDVDPAINRNKVRNNSGYGISIHSQSHNTQPIIHDNEITGNGLNDMGSQAGLYISGKAVPSIVGNTIDNNGAGIYVNYDDVNGNGDFALSNNIITNNQGYGVSVNGYAKPVINDNDIVGNTGYALENHTSFALVAKNNWWGVDDSAEINEGSNPKALSFIYDGNNDGNAGKVNYAGWLSFSIQDQSPPVTTLSSVSVISLLSFEITLSCNDDIGGVNSGCSKTYYSIDGSEPTTSSVLYEGVITLNESAIVKSFSIDVAGHQEAAVTKRFYIGDIDAQNASRSGELSLGDQETSQEFSAEISEPIILLSAPSYKNSGSGVAKVSSITSTEVTASFKEWGYLDGNHDVESVPYVALTKGRYLLSNGDELEVGELQLSSIQQWHETSFASSFAAAPTVILTSQSNETNKVFNLLTDNITSSGFSAKLAEQENNTVGEYAEKVGYLAYYKNELEPIEQSEPFVVSSNIEVSSDWSAVDSFAISLQEEASFDEELVHSSEFISMVNINGTILLQQVGELETDTSSLRRSIVDTDLDNIFDVLDTDDDNDGALDVEDTCPINSRLNSNGTTEGDIKSFQYCISNDVPPKVHFELALSDNFSNAETVKVLYWLEGNEQHWITLTRDPETGLFVTEIELNEYAASGSYDVRAMELTDNQGNEIYLNESQINLLGFNTSVDFNNPVSDSEKPSVTSLTTSGWSINNNEEPQITFTVVVEDNLSGLQDGILLELYSPTGTSIQEHGIKVANNTYSFDFVLNKYASSGVYPIYTIRLYDNAGNSNFSQDWIADNLEGYELVNPNSDTSAASLSYINLEAKFDEQSDRPILAINGLATDDVSGVEKVYLRLTRPSNGDLDKWQEIDNGENVLNRTFSSQIALPQIYESGEYKVDFVRLNDFAANEKTLSKTDIDEANQSSITSINLYYPDDEVSDSYEIEASTKDDFVFGANRSNDHLIGLSGNDYIFSGDGNDHVEAGAGDDLVIGGSGQGDDIYEGDEGFDTLKYTSAVQPIIVDFINGTASGINIDSDTFTGFERLIAGQSNDVIITDENINIILGYSGDDIIVASAGSDELTGGNGKDEFVFKDLSLATLANHTTIVDYQSEDSVVIVDHESASNLVWNTNLNDTVTTISVENELYFTTDGTDGYLILVSDVNAKENSFVVKLSNINNLGDISITSNSSNDLDEDGQYNYFDTDDDNDGVLDKDDAFSTNAAASVDTDLDGLPDSFHENCDDTCVIDSSLTLDLDDDNDGYSDIDELANETDGLSADSLPSDNDGDFISNLLDSDDDNDGYSDEDELANGTDSLSADSLPTDTDEDFVSDLLDTDDDNDLVLDVDDAFPLDSTESVDTDGDDIGNNVDTDDDGDGIIDENDSAPLNGSIGDEESPVFSELVDVTFEATGTTTDLDLVVPEVFDNNLNAPTVTSDYSDALPLGTHEITWTATDFAGNVSTATQLVTIVDTTAAMFNDFQIQTLSAMGIFSDVSDEINNVQAYDLVDGSINAVVIGDTLYRSGAHFVPVSATDSSGNIAETEVEVHINPLVELSQSRKVEPGASVVLPVTLSGNAAVYPVGVTYTLMQSGSIIATNELTISENISGVITIEIPNDALNGDVYSVAITSAKNAVLGFVTSIQLTVDQTNFIPTLILVTQQNDEKISVVDGQGGIVTVTAFVHDINVNDIHDITWSSLNNTLVDLNTDSLTSTFEFSPEGLTSDTYELTVNVSENNTSELYSISVDKNIVVDASLPPLDINTDSDNDGISDADEGYSDSDNDGISDYLDTDDNPSRLPIDDLTAAMQTLNGLSLSLGDIVTTSSGVTAANATVNVNDISTDEHFTTLSTITNFNVSGLTEAGQSVPIVIPLANGKTILEGSIYRKHSKSKGWFDFVVDSNNGVYSALADEDGNCPNPLSTQYQQGLTAGNNCIQLLIKDGGENDADGLANGMVKDPGVLTSEVINQAPVIVVNTDETANEGSVVTFDASETIDAENDMLTYQWVQLTGITVELSGQDTETLSFTAPQVSNDESLTFELTVNDGRDSTTTEVELLVLQVNIAPTVSIDSHTSSFDEGDSVSLKATGADEDADALSYAWEQTSGPTVTLSGASSASVTFTAPAVTSDQNLEFKVTVSDGVDTVSKTTTVTINNVAAVTPPVTPPKESGGGGGSMGWVLIVMSFGLLRKRLIKIAA
ncbi:right-handed parallel beta-helix repeat-containing protein [Colwellia sp. MB3u-55]|uniref:right-handed parallel beta-helix repeat-containing protein n=1 Tax=Colwellia sp. MB3u-55 TaxID=2759810 RepID=UPI0015F45729|nr:right-handed parallel beta-helix repeat-containing protein [Colwellia sp. MB3u-55]MBA6254094.1 right-handed parallel beta-helix repeat-containing protein [Colwellia sp. MB3u-55]